jgi:hypothetical protein
VFNCLGYTQGRNRRPHLNPLPRGEENTGRGSLWELGRETVRESPGEGFVVRSIIVCAIRDDRRRGRRHTLFGLSISRRADVVKGYFQLFVQNAGGGGSDTLQQLKAVG